MYNAPNFAGAGGGYEEIFVGADGIVAVFDASECGMLRRNGIYRRRWQFFRLHKLFRGDMHGLCWSRFNGSTRM
ncbi:MAG TPA: hypothetical protein DD624_01325 [Alphaproteobacteria bacterium]|nr:hypothetical protein [Alphaproteobacteria bacterium]